MEMIHKTGKLVAVGSGSNHLGLVALHTEFFVPVLTVLDANVGLAGCSKVADWTWFDAKES